MKAGRLPPPVMATVMATVGSSRWGRTQTGMPLLSLRTSGRARETRPAPCSEAALAVQRRLRTFLVFGPGPRA